MTLPTPEAIAELKAALPDAFVEDANDMAPWLTEWRGRWTGHSPILLQPRTTEEVQKAFYAVSEKLYKNAAPQEGAAGTDAGDNVVDADYETVD